MNSATRRVASERGRIGLTRGRLAGALTLGLAAAALLGLVACTSAEDEQRAAAVKAGRLLPTASTASTSSGTDLPARATDGDVTTVWNAGAFAPAWIQLDLGQPGSVSKVRLNVSQVPSGPSTHVIAGGPTPEALVPIGTIDGDTSDNQWLELAVPATNVRYLRISTTKSPSWVSWREIEVYK
jgi:hypothetical protein